MKSVLHFRSCTFGRSEAQRIACETVDDLTTHRRGFLIWVVVCRPPRPNMLGETPNLPYQDPAWLGNNPAKSQE